MSISLIAQTESVANAACLLPTDVGMVRGMSDDALTQLSGILARTRRAIAAQDALVAGEVARRSAPALGHSGLAQRLGFRTPEEMVRVTAEVSTTEARRAVRVGGLLNESQPIADPVTGEPQAPTRPWLRDVGAAVTAGTLSVAGAEAISNGLGVPTEDISEHVLAAAATSLLEGLASSGTVDADRLFRRARELRDEIDEAGIKDREAALRDKRSLTFISLPDGMSLLKWRMDPETAAVVGGLYDQTTSPRRGGPRFVNEKDAALSRAIEDDPRTTDQLASDVFRHLLENGAAADSSELLSTSDAVLMVIVPVESLEKNVGHGFIEGQSEPVSIETVQRLACDAVIVEMTVDESGNPIDVAKEKRLFNRRQRRGLAYRDGGCRWPGCRRHAHWSEAHHIHPWSKGGLTTLANGILLCRHHHMLLHDKGWDIESRDGQFWLVPPVDVDPERRPRLMESQSRAARNVGP
jgi:Domain of unknown function (DUF222)/HNH endonuclease